MIANAYLFVPAHKPTLLDKALDGKSDAIILDWEDAVQSSEKELARRLTQEKLLQLSKKNEPHKAIWLRINAQDSDYFVSDCQALTQLDLTQLQGIVLPKVENGEVINQLFQHFAKPIIPMIESAKGYLNLATIAQAKGVQALTFGGLDFANDLGFEQGNGADSYFDQLAFQLTLHSRLAGLAPPIDSVFANFKDREGFAKRCQHRLSQGFSGALCIHPIQVEVVQNIYGEHLKQQLVWAKNVLDASQQQGESAFQFNGKMIDKPVLDFAKKLLGIDK
ncbi:CoA ester lyase [Mergibacter septicus]|uniref:CoA ester lyase n=1 Tax=Mergibacter septicus TaxID=221402 RepID=A0A8D4LMD5_9PAST|nr:CoA ester lyase [Mergibacter septicus]AWX15652.1 CoA ester lyase [Mergibacter septicus]QDJ14906.1 CoA ester lyase [Mergibacter septicus]UTU47668.1 CoA ester lyase [Mergibacter septicus]WMR96727.1 CoA ester lyase [Mergibacter septicus]